MCILFVEDDPLITLVCEDALQDAGHEVITADNARAAVKLIVDHPGRFSCLMTDIHMPGGMTGFDVVRHMREHCLQIPIVVATGRPDAVQSEWRIRHGVTLLAKPFGVNLMISTIEHLLCGTPSSPSKDLGPALLCDTASPHRSICCSARAFLHCPQSNGQGCVSWQPIDLY